MSTTNIWKEETEEIIKEDILNSLDYNNVSDLQQMIYHNKKKIEELEERIQQLEKTLLKEVR